MGGKQGLGGKVMGNRANRRERDSLIKVCAVNWIRDRVVELMGLMWLNK